jgi:hypothetical protein
MLKAWTTAAYVNWWEYWISKVPQNLAPAENSVRRETPLRRKSEWSSHDSTVNRHEKTHGRPEGRRSAQEIGQKGAPDVEESSKWTGGWED